MTRAKKPLAGTVIAERTEIRNGRTYLVRSWGAA
jgi:hypothetical protein